jgi:hypothetical protein
MTNVTVTMPRDRWESLLLLLLESAGTLQAEGRTDLLAALMDEIVPPVEEACSMPIANLADEVRASLGLPASPVRIVRRGA